MLQMRQLLMIAMVSVGICEHFISQLPKEFECLVTVRKFDIVTIIIRRKAQPHIYIPAAYRVA
jgi:hypothetical protein